MIKTLLAFVVFFISGTAAAENVDFGGYPDEIKGGGDKVPPQCQVDIPRIASSRFEIKWFCSDNFTPSSDIESKLWIRRNGTPAFELLNSFMGFPAAGAIDESVLRSASFAEGLPIAIRVSAADKTGNQAISPAIIVSSGQEINSSCSLTIRTLPTESTGSTVGTPAMTLVANAQNVLISDSANRLSIATTANTIAKPCEIDELCFNQEQITFSGNLNSSGSAVNGAIELIPGNISVSLIGQSNEESRTVRLSGTTTIGDKEAAVTLSCVR